MENFNQENRKNSFINRGIYYFLIFLVCLVIGLIDGYRSYITSFRDGEFGVDLGDALQWDVTGWLIWVIFIPLIFYLSRRYPVNQKNWPRRLLFFLPFGLSLAFVRTLFPFLAQSALAQSFAPLEWLPNRYFYLSTDYLIGFVFYSVVLTLGQAVNYYKQYREEEFRVLQLESELSKAQIQALKMQLHPHFLFNALNSISALQHEDFETAQEMTARLGDFLRLTLENVGVQEVTLVQEIKFLKCYLDIEKVRFEKGLTTDIRIAPEVRFCRIPNLILQPLVENAIKHGIAGQRSVHGKININASRENGWLKIEIEDSGHGIGNKSLPDVISKGIGLRNTRERLQKHYGPKFHFQLQNSAKPDFGGLLVTICLPYQENENSSD